MKSNTTIQTEIVRIYTSDGLELHGLLFLPHGQTPAMGIVHLHGLAGNFYEQRFVYSIARQAISKGFAFFTFNNRGHDYISDINKETESGCDSVRLGGAYEIVRDCCHDISAAVDFLLGKGISKIVLQGHSTGANKVVFYQSQKNNECVKGLVLISPCDDIALQHEATKGRSAELLRLAQQLVSEGKEMQLMPDGSFYSYPMSAKTFVDYFEPNADQDVFPYRDPTNTFKAVAAIRVPIFFTFGKMGDSVLIPLEDACDILKQKAAKCPSLKWSLIDGASHSYSGKEEELATEITKWIMTI